MKEDGQTLAITKSSGRDGTVEDGRDINVSGAHAAGFNSVSVGVCLVGGRGKDNKAENNFTEAQMASFKRSC